MVRPSELAVSDLGSLRSISDVPTKKGHLSILLDANLNTWERRWFVLRRYISTFEFVRGVSFSPELSLV
jgi:hypothetical protein